MSRLICPECDTQIIWNTYDEYIFTELDVFYQCPNCHAQFKLSEGYDLYIKSINQYLKDIDLPIDTQIEALRREQQNYTEYIAAKQRAVEYDNMKKVLSEFLDKISIKDVNKEFDDIVNKEFWELI